MEIPITSLPKMIKARVGVLSESLGLDPGPKEDLGLLDLGKVIEVKVMRLKK